MKVRLWTNEVPSREIQQQVKEIMKEPFPFGSLRDLFGKIRYTSSKYDSQLDRMVVTDIHVDRDNVCTVIRYGGETCS